jgi:phosphotransferase family enzyme
MTATASALLDDLRFAWGEAGMPWTVSRDSSGQMELVVGREQRERAFGLTMSLLRAAGWRTCADRNNATWSVFGFSEQEAIRIDLLDGFQVKKSAGIGPLFGRLPPCVALAGPDGVGKSTAINTSCEWFKSQALFLEIRTRQWRPALLPPLAWFLGGGSDSSADTKPRRERGNLHALRLSYYFFDYLLGSWCKDRNRSDKSRLVVYDRCAIDMTVDPYRYGLASRRGTRLMWKLTPRPQTLILLYDDPARIYGRKGDLDEQDTTEQMHIWLKLAAGDQLHALIRADAGAAEVARCTRDLLVDAFIRHYEPGFRTSTSNVLDTIQKILEVAPEGTGEAYAILPSGRDPRFLLPVQDSKRAAVGLNIYNAQRPFARLSRRLLSAGLHAGVARPFLRDRVSINTRFLKEKLSPVFGGEKNMSFAISIGTPGPNQKPVLQITNALGQELGYAKIGWNQQTISGVSKEEAALRQLGGVRFLHGLVPKVLHGGCFGNRYLLVQSPCGAPGPAGVKLKSKHVQFLAELHQTDCSFDRLPYPQEKQMADLRRSGYHYFAHVLEGARQFCSPFETAPFGPLHGDFTAWNIRRDSGRLAIVDWECYRKSAPAAWDLFHFIVAGAVEVEDKLPGRIYASITGSGETADLVKAYFRLIGADPSLINPLLASYAAESLVQSLTELREDASAKDRQLRRTWAMLLALISCPNVLHAGRLSRVEVAAAQ